MTPVILLTVFCIVINYSSRDFLRGKKQVFRQNQGLFIKTRKIYDIVVF